MVGWCACVLYIMRKTSRLLVTPTQPPTKKEAARTGSSSLRLSSYPACAVFLLAKKTKGHSSVVVPEAAARFGAPSTASSIPPRKHFPARIR